MSEGSFWQALRRSLGKIRRRLYESKELIHVERSLESLRPRYTTHPTFGVREVLSQEVLSRECALPSGDRGVLLGAMAEGCRLFVLFNGEEWAGWMLVGRKYSYVNREFCYPIPSNHRHIVNLAIEIEPRYRKGKAAGFLKEAVMLRLKAEGFERVLGGIEITNSSSLSLARHFEFRQVRRVRVRKMLGLRWMTVLDSGQEAPLPRLRTGVSRGGSLSKA